MIHSYLLHYFQILTRITLIRDCLSCKFKITNTISDVKKMSAKHFTNNITYRFKDNVQWYRNIKT